MRIKKIPPPTVIRLRDLDPLVEQRAEAETGGNKSKLIRLALKSYLGGASRIADTAGLLAEVRALRTDLARIGNNLNQVAHRVNAEETTDPEELKTLFADMRRVFWDATQLTKTVIGELDKTA
jgi:hypothetical protein